MSNTKGSMLISNANAVGTELVNQLGGIGYKPSEWSDAINLLGISDDDKASALAGITEGTYTGTERGAIKYSNCNAVGAMLNKKFSTNRGFKPVEWESAISKLTPLTEGTVSGSICNIVNGADQVPVKNWLVTLPASLDGYTQVNGTKNTGTGTPETQYIASLGRTIYGGTADIVSGAGEAIFAYHKITADDEINLYPSANGFRIPTTSWVSGAMIYQANSGGLCNVLSTVTVSTGQGIRFGINNDQIYMVQCYALFGSTVEDFKTYVTNNDVYVVYRLATPTNFTFTPITPTPETALGVNNFWADEGDSEVTYRKDLDIPDPPVQLLNMNNNNDENNNEEV